MLLYYLDEVRAPLVNAPAKWSTMYIANVDIITTIRFLRLGIDFFSLFKSVYDG